MEAEIKTEQNEWQGLGFITHLKPQLALIIVPSLEKHSPEGESNFLALPGFGIL